MSRRPPLISQARLLFHPGSLKGLLAYNSTDCVDMFNTQRRHASTKLL